MPSPTSSTRPTSWARICSLKPTISRWRTETISSGLNLMIASLHQLLPDPVDARPDAGVVEPVADAQHEPAQQLGIDLRVQQRLALEDRADLLPDALLLVVVEGDCRADV